MEIKVPLYNVLNMFMTGIVFIGGCVLFFPNYAVSVLSCEIIKSAGTAPEIVCTVFIFAAAYEIGLIINRIGSVIIEPIFKKAKLIQFDDDYVLFNEKKKEYPIMNTLSREYALSRTGVVLFTSFSIMGIVASKCMISFACAIVTVVYYLSLRKHSAKIVKLMHSKKNGSEDSV